jgi:hypothetical protein
MSAVLVSELCAGLLYVARGRYLASLVLRFFDMVCTPRMHKVSLLLAPEWGLPLLVEWSM